MAKSKVTTLGDLDLIGDMTGGGTYEELLPLPAAVMPASKIQIVRSDGYESL